MSLPGGIGSELALALELRFGRPVRLAAASAVSGGCIHNALRVETSEGPTFVKWNEGDAGAAFGAEARALRVLGEAARADGLVTVPEVYGFRDARPGGPGWIAMEFLPPSPPAPRHWVCLGEGLALLHATTAANGGFGWPEENRIGSLPQPNEWTEDWAEFWRERRLRHQIRAAREEGLLAAEDQGWTDAVLEAVDAAFEGAEPARPGLVHGDLWSGNVHAGPTGMPVLVDPASYYGHGEVDLAMAQLFGGFPPEFFEAYRAVRPIPAGWSDRRRPLYQLYYLLVHLRLFGRSYYSGTRAAAQAVLEAI